MSPALEKDLFRRFTLLETWLPPDGLVEFLDLLKIEYF